MASTSTIAKVARQRRIERERARVCSDLFYLCSKYLGYDLMSEEFHGPIARWKDQNFHHRKLAYFSPRKSYKSTLEVGEIVQRILRDPSVTILLVHHKLSMANELVDEVAYHLQRNKKLRELIPAEHRPPTNKKFVTGGSGNNPSQFEMPGREYKRHPTLIAASVGQDLTGAHPEVIFMDDVISAKTVEEQGGVAGIKAWIEHTITPLVGTTGVLRVIGTFWSTDDWYHVIMKSPDWTFIKRAILETDGVPDWEGQPIPIYVRDKSSEDGRRWLTMDDVLELKREAKGNFPGQYMNDPQPKGTKPWDREKCEHFVSVPQVRKVVKTIAILMDPSPLGMGTNRKDGKKDYWSISVVGYGRFKNRTIRVLLDGRASQEWSLDDGLRICKKLMKKWHARLVGIEEPRGAGQVVGFFGSRLKEMCKKGSVMEHQRCLPVSFKSTQKGKSPRIIDLAAIAANEDFYINNDDWMDPEFLQLFLEQIRNWAGSNTIEFDDIVDSTAYLEDPAIQEHITLGTPFVRTDGPLDEPATPEAPPRRMTRYCPA